MLIPLPSNGILGISQVDMRAPSFRDIRNINQMNQQEDFVKFFFVQNLFTQSVDLNKITKMDMDYLFLVAAFSTQLNELSYAYKCTCGKEVKQKLALDTMEVDDLKKYRLPYKAKLNGAKYSYTILSAQQHYEALQYSLTQEDFDESYTDHIVSSILGISIEEVGLLPVTAYVSALLFQKANFHGVNMVIPTVCPHCGKLTNINVNLSTSVIRMDPTQIMESYFEVKGNVDFQTFLDFTSTEYRAYKNVLAVSES